ncbi:MAG: hypothetical protein KAW09_12340 [Thermoplasmata archaeon]|nr:hypothetical protein [Thermoplasmata archaeon]
MRIQPKEDGQSSVYDAMIFLSIMLVASALIVGASTHLLRAEDVHSYENLHQNSVRFTNAVLSSTVPNASYVDSFGFKVISKDISIQDMIIQELVLLESGVPEQNFRGEGGYNIRVEGVLSSLIDKDRFHCTLSGSHRSHEITFGDSFPDSPYEIAANTTEIYLPEDDASITITLYVWR